MANTLQKLLKQSVEKKQYIEKHGNSIDFPLLRECKDGFKMKPKKNNNRPSECFVVVPDVHSYIRDVKAVELMMKALPILNEHYNVTKFVQLGDLLEVGSFSSHPTSSVHDVVPEYSEEIRWAMDDFWKPIKKSLPNAEMIALMGNHEERLNKYIVSRMGRNDLACMIYNELMPYDLYKKEGIKVIPYGRADISEGVYELFPGLVCIHGWSIAKNAAGAHISEIGGNYSVLFGHTHRMQSDIKRNPITNEYIQAYSFGSLARVSMNWHYGKPMNHTLGFGIVFTHGDKFFVRNIEILMDGDKRTCLLPTGDILTL